MKCLPAVLAILAGSLAATGQTPQSTPLAAPVDPNAIVLNAPEKPAAQAEIWEQQGDNRSVRNVTRSTLTPFLPDPAKATGAAVIVAPGGAFMMLAIDYEGYQVARWLADHGIAAFLLKYRVLPTDPDPKIYQQQIQNLLQGIPPSGKVAIGAPAPAMDDARAAVRLVRSRAKEWHVDPARVGFNGFSAGAMLTLAIGLDADPAVRPDFLAPIYAPLSSTTVPAYAPPAFFAIAADDPLFSRGGFDLITAWHAAGRPVEFHYYEHGGHGFGMIHKGTTSDLWIDQFYAWMKTRGLLTAK